jgi:hypothetical protein
MDTLLFYSKNSPSCSQLFEALPFIEKIVCVDSPEIREKIGSLHIISVPTLLVMFQEKIVQRVIGVEDIIQWHELRMGPPQPQIIPQPTSLDFSSNETGITNLIPPDIEEKFSREEYVPQSLKGRVDPSVRGSNFGEQGPQSFAPTGDEGMPISKRLSASQLAEKIAAERDQTNLKV